MGNRVWVSSMIFAIVASSAGGRCAWAQSEAAPDAIYVNGTVVTMARAGEIVEAVAVREGKISAIGTSGQMRGLVGKTTKLVDLAGKTLLPGFYAAHDHFPSVGRTAL